MLTMYRLLEKQPAILREQQSANSAALHACTGAHLV